MIHNFSFLLKQKCQIIFHICTENWSSHNIKR